MPTYRYYPDDEASDSEGDSDLDGCFGEGHEIESFFSEHMGCLPSGAVQNNWIKSTRNYAETRKAVDMSKLPCGLNQHILMSAANLMARRYGGRMASIFSEMLIYYSGRS